MFHSALIRSGHLEAPTAPRGRFAEPRVLEGARHVSSNWRRIFETGTSTCKPRTWAGHSTLSPSAVGTIVLPSQIG